MPHPFAFFLAKGWDNSNPKETKSCGQRPGRNKLSGLRAWAFIPAVAVLAFLFIAACPAAAGYPDKDQLATGTPETKLSGITVGIRPVGTELPEGTPIPEIIKLYGPPTSKEDAVVPDGVGGTRFYKWEWPGLRMSVATYFYYGGAQQAMVESHPAYIDVWGDAPRGLLGVTGRRLQLGATLERQKILYGDRYTIPYTEKNGAKHVQMEWVDGAELMIDYGPNGHSNHIRLTCREK
jgi:hypothetical protein